MSVDVVREIRAREVEVGDELDFDGDEYGDNELAIFGYASVSDVIEWYDNDNDPWVVLNTSQGEFEMPAGHLVKLRIVE